MTAGTLTAAPASRIASRPAHRDHRWTADCRRIPLVILPPAEFDAYNATVDANWRELPGQGYGDAVIRGPLADIILAAIADHDLPRWMDAVWVADTAGRCRASGAYPFNGALKIAG